MKQLRALFLILSLALLTLAACNQQSGTWDSLGNLPDALVPPQGTLDLTLSPDGTPYVAYVTTAEGTPDIKVMRYVDRNWEVVGGGVVANNVGISVIPDIFVDFDGTPYVVWSDNSSGFVQIYARFYDGFSWAEIGPSSATGNGISNTPGASLWPSIVVGNDGFPIIAWSEDDAEGATNILLRRWDGTSWAHMGVNSGAAASRGISNTPGVATRPYLAISGDGVPTLAWQESTGLGIHIYVAQWDGFAWREITPGSREGQGVSAASAETSDNIGPVLLPGSGNEFLLSWANTSVSNGSGIQSAYAIGFDGSRWAELSGGSASSTGISGAGIDLAPEIDQDEAGNVYITWATLRENASEVHVQRLEDNRWVTVGEEPPFGVPDRVPVSGEAPLPQIAVASDGTIYVAWLVIGGNTVEVQRYNP